MKFTIVFLIIAIFAMADAKPRKLDPDNIQPWDSERKASKPLNEPLIDQNTEPSIFLGKSSKNLYDFLSEQDKAAMGFGIKRFDEVDERNHDGSRKTTGRCTKKNWENNRD